MFGTDHPFFPPLDEGEKWLSVETNYEGIKGALGIGSEDAKGALGGNAVKILHLTV
jgi:predicted TIM-barrel fold metal-dependent hydrolase